MTIACKVFSLENGVKAQKRIDHRNNTQVNQLETPLSFDFITSS